MPATSIAIEVSTTCGRCQSPLPINGASESVLCDKCQTPNETNIEFWKSILADEVGSALGMKPNEAHPSTIMTRGRTIKLLVGKQDARCSCKTPYDAEAFEHNASVGKVFCTSCGKQGTVRRAPDWMKEVHPAAAYLVGETLAAPSAHGVAAKDLRFHCYHCGAPLPIDGSARSVSCEHCRASVMVPDDIWLRLHPARTVDRWYAIIALDLANAKGMLPESTDAFCDVGTDVGGNVIVAYHAESRGDAGHPARVALLQPSGALTWIQDGVEFSDETQLFVSPVDGACFVVDREKGFVRAIDPKTGDPIRTFNSPDDEDEHTSLNVRGMDSFAIDWDGSFLVFNGRLRRFAPNGQPVPTWPGMRIAQGEKDDEIRWPAWPQQHPIHLPSHTLVGVGWDGAIYFVHAKGVAKYTRDGQLVGVLSFAENLVKDLHAFSVARDGTMMVLIEHAQRIGDDAWSHILRITPNGQIAVAFGPHVPNSPMIGRYSAKMKGFPDGTLIVASGVESLRVIAPNGTIAWMTNATRRDDEYETKRLTEARRGKKTVADRE